MGEWIGDKHLVSSAKRKRWEKLIVRGRSLMKMMNRSDQGYSLVEYPREQGGGLTADH